MDRNNILITMVSRQTDAGFEDSTETVYPGKGYENGGCYYVFYEEIDGDDGRATRASLRLRPRHIDIRKNGNVNSRMLFIPGQQTETEYHTPYGSLYMTIDTRVAEVEFDEGEVRAKLDYLLSLGGSAPVRNQLSITVRPVGDRYNR